VEMHVGPPRRRGARRHKKRPERRQPIVATHPTSRSMIPPTPGARKRLESASRRYPGAIVCHLRVTAYRGRVSKVHLRVSREHADFPEKNGRRSWHTTCSAVV
jgi:hypothetical protein